MKISLGNKWKKNSKFFYILPLLLILCAGCMNNADISREGFSDTLTDICKKKYQAYIYCKPVEDTIWVYLPYTPGRGGYAVVKEAGSDLYLDFVIKSFNPYKTIEPNELKFLIQKVLGEIRGLMLRSVHPYKFFVLVVTDIESPNNKFEDWYIGYADDVKKYGVGRDFSGEGFNRLAWYPKKIEVALNDEGKNMPQSYGDIDGKHVDYHDITLKEFIERQIEWRVYNRFTTNYNKIPYDLTTLERQDEIINIVKIVLTAYNFREFDKLYLKDVTWRIEEGKLRRDYSALQEDTLRRLSLDRDTVIKLEKARREKLMSDHSIPYYIGCLLKELEKYKAEETKRKPAF